ncbi:MAG: chitobiase/beta-hexosaminidase C-terminal domain-containing protein [Spirochaetaceae bacterium]|jgi:hypothetical protein|nr:chitobiase/beta-hexosaminidase C-terminal domain-containing protein [Spirochaetaceae bacterium]
MKSTGYRFGLTAAALVFAAGFFACEDNIVYVGGEMQDVYTRAARPSAMPPAGEVDGGTKVKLTTKPDDAVIYYTTDGTDPDPADETNDRSSTLRYDGPIEINGDKTVKAIAVKAGINNSSMLTAEYTIVAPGKVARPWANPPARAVASGTVVALGSTTGGAVVRYTTNGAAPTAASAIYTPGETVITIDAAKTVKAIAMKDGLANSSMLAAEYTIAGAGSGGDEEWTQATGITLGVAAPGITLVDNKLKLEVGQTVQLTAALTPSNASGGVSWVSSKPALFPVDETGRVTALDVGKAEIKAVAEAGGVTAVCTASVQAELTAGLYEGDIEDGAQMDLENTADANLITKAFAWIKANSTADTSYTVVLDDNITVTSGWTIGTGGGNTGTDNKNKNLKITLLGLTSDESTDNYEDNITIKMNGKNTLFTVYGNAADDVPELILGNNITLEGHSGNDKALVIVGNTVTTKTGKLTMEAGSRITGNTNSGSVVGTVRVVAGGEFTMNGGTIDANVSSNKTAKGGAVVVSADGTFDMTGGTISNNTVGTSDATSSGGGGVNSAGIFTMSGGSINNNHVLYKTNGYGGGVYVNGGTFTMEGTAVIEGNDAKLGGGVCLAQGAFAMTGGEIKGNKAATNAGAVLFYVNAFTKTGGVIYGKTEYNGLANTVTEPDTDEKKGHAIAKSDNKIYRDATAGASVSLDAATSANWDKWEEWED